MQKILGQSRSLEILDHALRSGRFHHAWIFSGPQGVGKFTTALALARILLDPEANQTDVEFSILDFGFGDTRRSAKHTIEVPTTKVQSLIDAGTHPDLHVIRKELALFSDNRDLRERKLSNIPLGLLHERLLGGTTSDGRTHESPAYRTAVLGHAKVFIIDEAELLDTIAQNAMLKTLEEPPAHTYFILITNQPDRLLLTIRSRCQHVRFGPLDPSSMQRWMQEKIASESTVQVNRKRDEANRWQASDEEFSWVEQFAEGSPGIAQLAVEYGFYQWHKTLQPMLADLERGKFPAAMGETLSGFAEEFATTWVKNHKNASKDAANKDGTKHLFSLLAAYARHQLENGIAQSEDTQHVIHMIDLLREAERQLESNVNMKLVLENLVVQWAQRAELAIA